MKKTVIAAVLAALVAGCGHPLESVLRDSGENVTSIQILRMGSTSKGWEGVASVTVTNAHDIQALLESVDCGFATPYTRHPFQYRAVFKHSDGTEIAFTFEKHQGCFARYGDKQYRMSERTYDALLSHMNREDSNNTSDGIRQPADGLPKPSR